MNKLENTKQYVMIKILYSFLMGTFLYIIWLSMVTALRFLEPKTLDFSTVIIMIFLINYFKHKKLEKKIYIPMLLVINYVLTFFMYKSVDAIYFGLVGVIFIILNEKYDETNIYSSYYLKMGKAMILIMGANLIFYLRIPESYYNDLFRYYIIFAGLWVFLLRSSRKYNYKITNKDDKKINILTLLTIVVLSSDIYKVILGVFQMAFNMLIELLALIMKPLLYIMKPVIDFIGKYLLKFIGWLSTMFQKSPKLQVAEGESTVETIVYSDGSLNTEVLGLALKVIAVIIIIFFIFMIIRKKSSKLEQNEEVNYEEIREKINKKPKKKFSKEKFNVFSNSSEEKVKLYYKKFLGRAKKKEIFNSSMTSKEVYVKATSTTEVDKEALGDITKLYTEIKFSNHKTKKDVDNIAKNDYLKIKEKI